MDGLWLHPHLWCSLATHSRRSDDASRGASRAARSGDEEPDAAEQSLEVSVEHACSVMAETRRGLHSKDEVMWDESCGAYRVHHGNVSVGTLLTSEGLAVCRECLRHHDGDAWQAGYVVVGHILEARPECERVMLNAPFARMFPAFTRTAVDVAGRLDEMLSDIHLCLGRGVEVGMSKPPCSPEEELPHSRDLAAKVVNTLRGFLLHLGATPRVPDKRLQDDAGPDDKRMALEGDRGEIVQRMARDFVDAFGTHEADDMARWFDAPVPDGNQRRGESGDVRLRLAGWMWRDVPRLRDVILVVDDPFDEMLAPHLRAPTRPPMEIMFASTVSRVASRINICDPQPTFFEYSEVTMRFARSWSDVRREEFCQVGRVRPSTSSIQVYRCSGKSPASKEYYEWRIRTQATVMKLEPVMHQNPAVPLLQAIEDYLVFYSAEFVGSMSSKNLINKVAPRLATRELYESVALSLSMASPLTMEVLGTAASTMVIHKQAFAATCISLLTRMQTHSLVDGEGPWTPMPVAAAKSRVDFWSTNVHRQTVYRISRPGGPPRLRAEGGWNLVRSDRFSSTAFVLKTGLHGKTPSSAIAGATALGLTAAVHVRYDITPVVGLWTQVRQARDHQARVDRCANCTSHGLGFCDWSLLLGNMLTPEEDACMEHNESARADCVADLGVVGPGGVPVAGVYYAPDLVAAAPTCDGMPAPPVNREAGAIGGRNVFRFMDRW